MILQANGDEYRPQAAPTTILDADGKAYEPPDVLAKDEFEIMLKAFGINRRTGKATRNIFRAGKLPDIITHDAQGEEVRHTHPMAQLLNEMSAQGLVQLGIEPRGLSKKTLKRMQEGDLRGGRLVAVVTKRGMRAFDETVRQARAAQDVPE